MTSCFRQVWNEIKWKLFTYGWDSYMREWSMWRVTPLSNTLLHWYILTNFWYAICGLSYLLKTKPINILLLWNGPPSLDYHYKKNGDETFGWWGFRNGDTTRNKNKPPPWLDVTSVWHLFDRNVRIVEWFSWLIIKTALDRNRRVVTTNTCVFS